MARCSRCKQQHWPLHKSKGYVLCEPCLADIAGGFQIGGFWSGIKDIFGKIEDVVHRGIDRIRGIKQVEIKETRKPQRPSNKYATVKPSKLVRIGGDYQKV